MSKQVQGSLDILVNPGVPELRGTRNGHTSGRCKVYQVKGRYGGCRVLPFCMQIQIYCKSIRVIQVALGNIRSTHILFVLERNSGVISNYLSSPSNDVLDHNLQCSSIVFLAVQPHRRKKCLMEHARITKDSSCQAFVFVDAVIDRHPKPGQHDRYEAACVRVRKVYIDRLDLPAGTCSTNIVKIMAW
jgi:hypothetical protein